MDPVYPPHAQSHALHTLDDAFTMLLIAPIVKKKLACGIHAGRDVWQKSHRASDA